METKLIYEVEELAKDRDGLKVLTPNGNIIKSLDAYMGLWCINGKENKGFFTTQQLINTYGSRAEYVVLPA